MMKRKPESEQEALPAELWKMLTEEGAAQVCAWAEMDTWSIEEGLLLISGIYPDGAEVEWGGNRLGGVHIRNAWPLGERITFLSIPAPTIKLGNLEELPDNGLIATGGEVDLDEQKIRKLSVLRDLEQTLDRARRLWVSGQHDGKRYPPNHFIEWAKSKGITVSSDLEKLTSDRDEFDEESSDGKRIRFAQMKNESGKSDAEIAKGLGISRERFRQLRSAGEKLLANQASKASTLAGQLMPAGVAVKKRKK